MFNFLFLSRQWLIRLPVNTVHFFKWVIVENTLVMVASSVPLLRPLFNVAKTTALTHYGQNSGAYELNSRQKGSQAFAYGNNTIKSIALASSSEENILPIQKGPLSVREREREREGHFGADVEQGVIKKEVQYQIKYESDAEATAPSSQWALHTNAGAQ